MSTRPEVSIVIPARNEEHNLPGCLDALNSAAQYARIEVEVIVVANRCTDSTEEVAQTLGCRVVKDQSKNLAHIRNRGVELCRNEFVLTVDADSRVSKNLIKNIAAILEDPSYVGGGVLILPERWSAGIFCTGLMLLPIAIFYRISGGVFFFRQADFKEIGGFNEELYSVEDIDFAKRLKAHGRNTDRKYKNFLRSYIVTSCRKFDQFGDWYFFLRPLTVYRLLKGKNKKLANQVWYDFEEK